LDQESSSTGKFRFKGLRKAINFTEKKQEEGTESFEMEKQLQT